MIEAYYIEIGKQAFILVNSAKEIAALELVEASEQELQQQQQQQQQEPLSFGLLKACTVADRTKGISCTVDGGTRVVAIRQNAGRAIPDYPYLTMGDDSCEVYTFTDRRSWTQEAPDLTDSGVEFVVYDLSDTVVEPHWLTATYVYDHKLEAFSHRKVKVGIRKGTTIKTNTRPKG